MLWETARHPNVLRFLGIWEANDTVYLVSFFLDNGTVMKYLGAHPDADRPKFVSTTDVLQFRFNVSQVFDAP